MKDWKVVNRVHQSNAKIVPPNERASKSLNPANPLAAIRDAPLSVGQIKAKIRANADVLQYFREHLRIILRAQLEHDRAVVDFELEKVMALIREDRLEFLDSLGLAQLERRREVARNLQEIVKSWLLELSDADMPEFMREYQIEKVMREWERTFEQIMGDRLLRVRGAESDNSK